MLFQEDVDIIPPDSTDTTDSEDEAAVAETTTQQPPTRPQFSWHPRDNPFYNEVHPSPEAMGPEYFRGLRPNINRQWQQHNAALKFLREKAEWFPEPIAYLDFKGNSTWYIPECVHAQSGTEYWWDEATVWPWSWQEMVAQISDTYMDILVRGSNIRCRGIVKCGLFMLNIKDRKRMNVVYQRTGQRATQTLFEWHFIMNREDGTWCSFRPTYSKNTVQFFEGDEEMNDSDEGGNAHGTGPRRGPGAYKHYKTKHQTMELKFDGNIFLQNKRRAMRGEHTLRRPLTLRPGHEALIQTPQSRTPNLQMSSSSSDAAAADAEPADEAAGSTATTAAVAAAEAQTKAAQPNINRAVVAVDTAAVADADSDSSVGTVFNFGQPLAAVAEDAEISSDGTEF